MDGNHARALLGVHEHATTGQIRRAFRDAAFVAHPDQGGDPVRFRSLVAARDLLLGRAPEDTPGADPFAERLRAPRPAAFSVLDHHRPAPARAPEASSTDHGDDFDAVLAAILAA